MGLATTNTLYPVYVYEEGMELPKEGTYFVVAGNGLYMHKDTGLVRCFVPVNKIGVLEDLSAEAEVECKLPKIPARLTWRVKEFFRRVVEVHRAEAEVTLYYNKDTQDYKLHIPEQEVSHAGVRYKRQALTHVPGMEGYLRVGTIHSHCDFGAFHSGTDIGDERDFDGLHVTFGHNDRDEFTISATVVVNDNRVKIDPLTVLEGLRFVSEPETYALIDADYDREHHEWAQGIDKWMEQVTGSGRGWFASSFNRDPNAINKGSKVVWVSDTSPLKAAMGDGPFEVLEASPNKVVIKTKVGLARLSSKLFKKV